VAYGHHSVVLSSTKKCLSVYPYKPHFAYRPIEILIPGRNGSPMYPLEVVDAAAVTTEGMVAGAAGMRQTTVMIME
jgi:hypothetical protein